MRSSIILPANAGSASQYNNLRLDAYAASQLLAHQQASPGMTLLVEAGVFYVANVLVAFAGGSSPTVTAPVSNPRIDLLVINSSGTLSWVTGSEGASPAVPTYPTDKLTICEVYNKVGETTLLDATSGGAGYIQKDSRPFLTLPYIGNANQVSNGVVADVALASTFVKTSTDQTVGGIKTFTALPVLPGDPVNGNDAVRKSYIDGLAALNTGLSVSDGVTINYAKVAHVIIVQGAGGNACDGGTNLTATANRICTKLGLTNTGTYVTIATNGGSAPSYNLAYWNGSAWTTRAANSGGDTILAAILTS